METAAVINHLERQVWVLGVSIGVRRFYSDSGASLGGGRPILKTTLFPTFLSSSEPQTTGIKLKIRNQGLTTCLLAKQEGMLLHGSLVTEHYLKTLHFLSALWSFITSFSTFSPSLLL